MKDITLILRDAAKRPLLRMRAFYYFCFIPFTASW